MSTKLVATRRGKRVLNATYFTLGVLGTAGVIFLTGAMETFL